MGITSKAEYKSKLIKYGKNDIDIPIKSVPRLLIEEIINPFYVFQVLNISLISYRYAVWHYGFGMVIVCMQQLY
jgi:hypothetical protein